MSNKRGKIEFRSTVLIYKQVNGSSMHISNIMDWERERRLQKKVPSYNFYPCSCVTWVPVRTP